MNILFNLARICTIASKPKTCNKSLQELKQILLKRQYPLKLIANRLNMTCQSNKYPRNTKDTPDTSNNLPFITTCKARNTEVISQNTSVLSHMYTDITHPDFAHMYSRP